MENQKNPKSGRMNKNHQKRKKKQHEVQARQEKVWTGTTPTFKKEAHQLMTNWTPTSATPTLKFKKEVYQPIKHWTPSEPWLISVDMSKPLMAYMVQAAIMSIDKFNDNLKMTNFLKKLFSIDLGGCWVVIVGQNFCTYITRNCYVDNKFCHFVIGGRGFLIFRCI